MIYCPRGWVLLLCLAALVPGARATAQTSSPAASQAGLESPWDVRKTIADVLKQADELRPVLDRLNPQEWAAKKGAPDAYIVQRSVAERQLNDVTIATKLFSQNTEKLSVGLDLYFRLEALDVTAQSLNQGAREYADRGTADKLAQLIGADFTSRQQLQTDLVDLARSQEEDFKIADEEAQRCRGTISREGPVMSGKRVKK